MVPKLKEAKYISAYTIWLRFEDGLEGEVDLESELWGEVFEPIKDQEEFKAFQLNSELNTIAWPSGADFAPEFLYQSSSWLSLTRRA
jgi:hypothetical protein